MAPTDHGSLITDHDPDVGGRRSRRGIHGTLESVVFDEVYERFRRPIWRLGRRLTGSDEEAFDATQEIFLRVWRGLAGFRGEAKLSTWVFQIAWNYLRGHHRRRGRHLKAVVDQSEEIVARTPDPAPGPERQAVSSDLLERVTAAMDELARTLSDRRVAARWRGSQLLGDRRGARSPHRHRSFTARAGESGAQEGGGSVMDESLRELVSRYIDGDLDDAESIPARGARRHRSRARRRDRCRPAASERPFGPSRTAWSRPRRWTGSWNRCVRRRPSRRNGSGRSIAGSGSLLRWCSG